MLGKKRPVKVRLRTVQVDPLGDTVQMEYEYLGLLYDRPSERYIIFEEPEPKVTTSYKIKDDEVLVTRRGEISCAQIFRTGVWDHYTYQIAEGSLDLRSLTQRVATEFTDDGGEIHLEYKLWSGDELLGDYRLELIVEPEPAAA
ncbi:MAG: DUF1934 domain-containing protein [Candidatus Sericytochromatia bacterium]|nr:DUF1934 domain-containing protein [Candidatus Sericytochromatia bacterium]